MSSNPKNNVLTIHMRKTKKRVTAATKLHVQALARSKRTWAQRKRQHKAATKLQALARDNTQKIGGLSGLPPLAFYTYIHMGGRWWVLPPSLYLDQVCYVRERGVRLGGLVRDERDVLWGSSLQPVNWVWWCEPRT